MIIIKPESATIKLLQYLSVVGEFPLTVLDLLGSKRTYRELIRRYTLRQEMRFSRSGNNYVLRFLSLSNKGKYKTVRLYKPAIEVLQEIHPLAESYYMEAFAGHHFPGDLAHIDRNHRVAECVATIQAAGVPYIPYQLPPLQKSRIAHVVSSDSSFYLAKNIKKLDDAEMNKTMFTRVSGMLFYPGGCYAVYNTRFSMMKWSGMGEYKARHHLMEIARMNAGIDTVDSAILFGATTGIGLETLKEQKKIQKAEMRFDRIYHHVHYLPMNQDGVQLLRLLVLEDWKERLMQALFPPELRPAGIPNMEYDAKNGSTYLYVSIDNDIARITRLRDGLATTDAPYEIICLPWQVDFVKSYLGDRVRLRTIPADTIWEAISDA